MIYKTVNDDLSDGREGLSPTGEHNDKVPQEDGTKKDEGPPQELIGKIPQEGNTRKDNELNSEKEERPSNIEEYCMRMDKNEFLLHERVHPMALCLLQMRDDDIIFVPSKGNVSMMKPKNAAEIMDGLLGGKLNLKPHVPRGQALDANKMQIMTTYARISIY